MESIWQKSCKIEKRKSLHGDINVDVAVIGAGMAGILTAYKLGQEGFNVVVVEASRTASGQSAKTTAKITAQHGAIYSRLTEKFGLEKAKQYARANLAALDEYRKIIAEKSIQCDFEEKDSYIFSLDDSEKMKKEALACTNLGMNAEFLPSAESLPFPVTGCVCLKNQAQFNPLKFIFSLSKEIKIYENTPVLSVGNDTLTTPNGRIKAKHIVHACHYPFVNFPGMYFIKMHQERSYILALQGAKEVGAMFIDADHGISLRDYNGAVLLGGAAHRTGENSLSGRYEKLEKTARSLFPDSRIIAKWSAQDCMTADEVPYIGRFSRLKENHYVATGFQKWGMTTSMAAAQIITDMICGRHNENAEVFSPSRFSFSALSQITKQSGQALKGIARQNLSFPKEQLDSIPKGHGGVVRYKGKQAGVYKDENGKIFAVDTRCPHLGCRLEWNGDEKSWDCPCHGSRFDYTGKLIDNPAQASCKRIE